MTPLLSLVRAEAASHNATAQPLARQPVKVPLAS